MGILKVIMIILSALFGVCALDNIEDTVWFMKCIFGMIVCGGLSILLQYIV